MLRDYSLMAVGLANVLGNPEPVPASEFKLKTQNWMLTQIKDIQLDPNGAHIHIIYSI